MAKKIVMYASKGKIKAAIGTFNSLEEIEVYTDLLGKDVKVTFEYEN